MRIEITSVAPDPISVDLDAEPGTPRERLLALACVEAAARRQTLAGRNLVGADFSGMALDQANLSNCDLTDANLKGANLSRVNLSGAVLDGVDMSDAKLVDVDLSGVRAEGVVLRGATLVRPNLSGAKLFEPDLTRATLVDATGPQLVLGRATLDDCAFEKGGLPHALIEDTVSAVRLRLTGVNLADAFFERSVLVEATFASCDGDYATFNKVEFKRGRLASCNLPGLDLNEAKMDGTGLVDLKGVRATLRLANLKNVQMARVDFGRATVIATEVEGSTLREVSFAEANASSLEIKGCTAAGLDFRGTRADSFELLDCSVKRGRFDGCAFVATTIRGGRVAATFAGANLGQATLEADFVDPPGPEAFELAGPGAPNR